MLICIPDVLSKSDVADFRRIMDAAEWEDGRSTAGSQSAMVKKNEQLPPNGDFARKLGRTHRCWRSPPIRSSSRPAIPLQHFSAAVQSLWRRASISASMSTIPFAATI